MSMPERTITPTREVVLTPEDKALFAAAAEALPVGKLPAYAKLWRRNGVPDLLPQGKFYQVYQVVRRNKARLARMVPPAPSGEASEPKAPAEPTPEPPAPSGKGQRQPQTQQYPQRRR